MLEAGGSCKKSKAFHYFGAHQFFSFRGVNLFYDPFFGMTTVFHIFYIVIQKLGPTQAISDEFYRKVTGISTWVDNWQLPKLNIDDTDGGNPSITTWDALFTL